MWDGEVVAVRGLLLAPRDWRVLILSDSQAAIAAVRKAGRIGKARARGLVGTQRSEMRLGEGSRRHPRE